MLRSSIEMPGIRLRRAVVLAICIPFLFPSFLSAQGLPQSFELSKAAGGGTSGSKPLSNSAVEFLVSGDSVWVAGGKGLDLTTNTGADWTHFGSQSPFDLEDIAALDGNGPHIWASMAGSEETESGNLPKGLGLGFSTDNGVSWDRISQPMEAESESVYEIQYGDNIIPALAITTPFNNITYDLAVTDEAVWIASFAGGLRKSTDGGKTFIPVVLPPDFLDSIAPEDTLDFELSPVSRPDLGLRESLNHRVFSVHAVSDSVIWVGTAGGINLSTDAGVSWRKFTFNNQLQPISGNFVVAIGDNVIDNKTIIWAASINATSPSEFRAVSFSSDMGESWGTALRGEFTHNFGFKGDIVYATTNSGVYRSDDGGLSWIGFSRFIDHTTGAVAAEERCFAAAAQGDVVWVANSDGLILTEDSETKFFGSEWTILRASQSLASASDVYVYPNPFAPDDEVARVHYLMEGTGSVSIRIYDYAMFPVRTLLRSASRLTGIEHDEIWDGRNDTGEQVANGIYYVEVTIGDNDPAWGKIIVLQ